MCNVAKCLETGKVPLSAVAIVPVMLANPRFHIALAGCLPDHVREECPQGHICLAKLTPPLEPPRVSSIFRQAIQLIAAGL